MQVRSVPLWLCKHIRKADYTPSTYGQLATKHGMSVCWRETDVRPRVKQRRRLKRVPEEWASLTFFAWPCGSKDQSPCGEGAVFTIS